MQWQDALAAVAEFSRGGRACANYPAQVRPGWRLANVNELESLVDFGEASLEPTAGHPFVGVALSYWTSSTYVSRPVRAWRVLMHGEVNDAPKHWSRHVWPVRNGR